MVQADLIVKLIKSVSDSDLVAFQKITEAIISEEQRKGHRIVAERMQKALRPSFVNKKKIQILESHKENYFMS